MEPSTVSTILLIVLAIAAGVGLAKGLVRQVVELAGLVASFVLAMLFAGSVASLLQEHASIPYSPALVVSFGLVFIAALVAFHFIALALQRIVRMTFLGWVDRLCGAMLGLIVGLILTSLAVSLALELPLPSRVHRAVEESTVSLFVQPIAPWIFDAILEHGRGGVAFDSIVKRRNV